MLCDSLHVYLLTQSRIIILLPILIANRLSCIRLIDGPNIKLVGLFELVGAGLSLVCCLVIRCSTGGFLLLLAFSGISQPRGLRVSQYVVFVKSSPLIHHRPYS